MKNLLTLIGSPRKKGNSSLMSDMMNQKLIVTNYQTEKLHLYDYDIKPCIDCRECKKGDMKCVIDDGMKELYAKTDDAELIIIGTHIYWFGSIAQTKLLLDKTNCCCKYIDMQSLN